MHWASYRYFVWVDINWLKWSITSAYYKTFFNVIPDPIGNPEKEQVQVNKLT
jgi:hypothetical protein